MMEIITRKECIQNLEKLIDTPDTFDEKDIEDLTWVLNYVKTIKPSPTEEVN